MSDHTHHRKLILYRDNRDPRGVNRTKRKFWFSERQWMAADRLIRSTARIANMRDLVFALSWLYQKPFFQKIVLEKLEARDWEPPTIYRNHPWFWNGKRKDLTGLVRAQKKILRVPSLNTPLTMGLESIEDPDWIPTVIGKSNSQFGAPHRFEEDQ